MNEKIGPKEMYLVMRDWWFNKFKTDCFDVRREKEINTTI